MNKIVRKNVLQHFLIIVGVIIFFSINRYFKNIDKERKAENLRTVGYLYEVGYNVRASSITCRYYYYINNVRYLGVDGLDNYKSTKYYIKEGNYYEIYYHPQKNNFSKIDLNKQVPKDSVCNYFEGDCPFEIE